MSRQLRHGVMSFLSRARSRIHHRKLNHVRRRAGLRDLCGYRDNASSTSSQKETKEWRE